MGEEPKTEKRTGLKRTAALLTAFFLLPSPVWAAEPEAEVRIVSFLRGEVSDLRASELLEARVEGYSGSVRELTYTWTDNIGTFLYAYNSHNMYGIGETKSEVRLGTNSSYPAEEYPSSGGGRGFAWAAVSGANVNSEKLGGKLEGARVSVTVTDDGGNVIGTASYDRAFGGNRLSSDLAAGTYGIFEGDTINLKAVLAGGGIVHCDCGETTVKRAEVTNGEEFLQIDPDTFDVIGIAAGEAEISFAIEKANCMFHRCNTPYGTGGMVVGGGTASGATIPEAEAKEVSVRVFKRPVTSTTTTTLTISADSVEEGCDYFVNGRSGERTEDGSIVFAGLNRNTRCELEVRKAYTSDGITKYAYAYDNTDPMYRGTVRVYLNGVPANIEDILGEGTRLYLKGGGSNYIQLEQDGETGSCSAPLEDGTYYIYAEKDGEFTKTGEQQLIINGENRERELHYFSVDYDSGLKSEYRLDGEAVYISDETPQKDGYAFKGWRADDGAVYQPGELLTSNIGGRRVLCAEWAKLKNVRINVVVSHFCERDGGRIYDDRADGAAAVSLWMEIEEESGVYEQTGEPARYTEDGGAGYEVSVSEEDGHRAVTRYTASEPAFFGLDSSRRYSVSALADGTYHYSLRSAEWDEDESDEDEDVYNVYLEYDPDNFNLRFELKMADDVPETVYPISVMTRITTYADGEWRTIEPHEKAGVSVDIDPKTGAGEGSYPVPVTLGGGRALYRIEIVGAVLSDGKTRVTADALDGGAYRFGRYTAEIFAEGESAGGLDAVYCDTDTDLQSGVLAAVVSAEAYNVKFDCAGGTQIESEILYRLPDLSRYVPLREGYEFMGWYTDEALTSRAVSDTPLDGDITLFAKWRRAELEIHGTVTVDAAEDTDPPASALILLQEIGGDGYGATAAQTRTELGEYSGGRAEGSYSFTVPNNEREYRVAVLAANYGESYRNVSGGDYDEANYTALFTDGRAEVDILLTFAPQTYDQTYELDASMIGAACRPLRAKIRLLCDDGSEKRVAAESETALDSGGFGSGSCAVWARRSGSETEYDYSMKAVEFDGGEYDERTAPFRIEYSGTARYSPLGGGATSTLGAVLRPKTYSVLFDLNAGGDAVTGMEEYFFDEIADGGETAERLTGFCTTHTWSYDTAITARPRRGGYIFRGWRNESGEIVSTLPAAVCADIVLTAEWEPAGLIAELDGGTLKVSLREPHGGVLIAAEYSTDGSLLAADLTDAAASRTDYEVELCADPAYIRLMLWDGVGKMEPLAGAAELWF